MSLDGRNFKTIQEALNIYPSIVYLVMLDGELYALTINGINRIDKKSGKQTLVINLKPYFIQMGEKMKAANIIPKRGENEDCIDHEKCFGLVNKWICLKPDDICDGKPLCYENYDEFLCSLCTKNCKLSSIEIICDPMVYKDINISKLAQFLSWENHTFSKLIDLKSLFEFDCSVTFYMESSMDHVNIYEIYSVYHLHRLRQMIMILLLKNLKNLNTIKLVGLPLLKKLTAGTLAVVRAISSLYLEGSFITFLPNQAFLGLLAVKELYFVKNKYLRSFDPGCFRSLTLLRQISITGSQWTIVSRHKFLDQMNLTILNLSSNSIQILEKGIFDNLRALKLVDLRFNRIILTSNVFLQSINLEIIFGDSFTIRCIKPEEAACFASVDDISSCRIIIGNRVLASLLWLLGILAFFGNLIVLIYRACVDKSLFAKSYFIFVYNLAISDLIMALYMQKRISIVVITDCLCWLPVGVLVILSLAGIKTPSEVYSWVVVFVLPVNVAINPYIYTLSKLGAMKKFFCMEKSTPEIRN